jgi:hypothetical protein
MSFTHISFLYYCRNIIFHFCVTCHVARVVSHVCPYMLVRKAFRKLVLPQVWSRSLVPRVANGQLPPATSRGMACKLQVQRDTHAARPHASPKSTPQKNTRDIGMNLLASRHAGVVLGPVRPDAGTHSRPSGFALRGSIPRELPLKLFVSWLGRGSVQNKLDAVRVGRGSTMSYLGPADWDRE